MSPELKFRLTYTISFQDGAIKFVPENTHGGDRVLCVDVTKWPGQDTQIKGKPIDPPRVGGAEAVLLTELARHESFPESCEFACAYVVLAPGDFECVAYDRVTTKGRPIIPAMYYRADAPALRSLIVDQLKRIATQYGDPNMLPVWATHAAHITHNIAFTYLNTDGKALKVRITDDVEVFRHLLGEYCGALPLPGDFDKSLDLKSAILISRRKDDGTLELSQRIWDALNSLNIVWRNEHKQVLFLQGAPGSGKEIFGRAAHSGCVRADNREMQQLAVAGVSLSALRETLFGSTAPKGGVVDGLIAMAEGGTMFLDEFDKASTEDSRSDFYSTLLRVLESDQYYPEGSLTERKVRDVHWILAGAFSDATLLKKMPKDIWSRCSDKLTLENPIEEEGYARSMFVYWHLIETAWWLRGENKSLGNLGGDDTLARVISRWLLWGGQDQTATKASSDPLRPGKRILDLAHAIEQKLVDVGGEIAQEKSSGHGLFARKRQVSRGEALREWGVRTLRQASTAASRELRTSIVRKLGENPSRISEDLEKDDVLIDPLMKRVEDVLSLQRLGA